MDSEMSDPHLTPLLRPVRIANASCFVTEDMSKSGKLHYHVYCHCVMRPKWWRWTAGFLSEPGTSSHSWPWIVSSKTRLLIFQNR